MTPRQAAAARRVIDTAKQIERAAGYGISTAAAVDAYDQAREQQRQARQGEEG